MSNDKTKEPLLSEETFRAEIERWNGSIDDWGRATERKCFEIMSVPYEASRKQDKDRIDELTGLVQELVDALEGTKRKPDWWRHRPSEEWIYDAINRAKEAGFTPNT